MMAKNVVVDFSYLGILCGFGSIAENYSRQLVARQTSGLHFIFIVPDEYVGTFGPEIDYFRKSHLKEDADSYGQPIHLWHATTQNYEYRRLSSGTKQLLTVHDLNFLYEKRHIHRWKHLWKLRQRVHHSDAVTMISNFVADDLAQHVNLKGKPVQVIYNGVNDLRQIDEQRPTFIPDDNERFFFAIGQILEKKGFARLIPMMHHFPDHRLYICGDTQFPYADTLCRLIKQQGEGRCVLAGRITEAEKAWMYRHCEAFMLPSQSEGFGLPVIEAMQLKRPVFLSNQTSLPEIGSHYAFYWQPTDDAQRMADIVRKGLTTSNASQLTAEQAYALTFSYERYTDAYISLYQQLLNK